MRNSVPTYSVPPTASQTLAGFAADLQWNDLPADVVTKVKQHLLDTVGVAIAGSATPFAANVTAAVQPLAHAGAALVLGSEQRLPPVWAAFINGAHTHALDFDDTHSESVVHVSASVVPAALAAVQMLPAPGGRDLLLALALGMETAIRLGLAAPSAFHDRGFHPTGICGTFAAAALAGRLARDDGHTIANALGLCASTAAGSLECLSDGTWAKRIHGGWAAHSGLTAAALARAGVSGPRGALDGRFGIYRSHLGETGDLATLTADLGRRWHLLDTALKPYPCCHFNHAFIDASAALRRAHAFDMQSIERIVCTIPAPEVPIVCEPAAAKRKPQTAYDAKFSLNFTVACMLERGHVGIDDFDASSIADENVLALSSRIDYVPVDDDNYPRRFPGRVRIELADGNALEHDEPINRGSAERPLSPAQIAEKFTTNARRKLAPAQAARIESAIDQLDADADLDELLTALEATA